MASPETIAEDPLDEKGWMFKGSVFGSRLPVPDEKNELLNASSLKKLLPKGRDHGLNKPSVESGAADRMLERLLQGRDPRLKELDVVAATNDLLNSDGGGGRRVGKGKRKQQKRPRSAMGSAGSLRSGGSSWDRHSDAAPLETAGRGSNNHAAAGRRPGLAELAPPDMLEAIGMTPKEFAAIDAAYQTVNFAASQPEKFNSSSSSSIGSGVGGGVYAGHASSLPLARVGRSKNSAAFRIAELGERLHQTLSALELQGTEAAPGSDGCGGAGLGGGGGGEGLVPSDKVRAAILSATGVAEGVSIDLDLASLEEALQKSCVVGGLGLGDTWRDDQEGGGDDGGDSKVEVVPKRQIPAPALSGSPASAPPASSFSTTSQQPPCFLVRAGEVVERVKALVALEAVAREIGPSHAVAVETFEQEQEAEAEKERQREQQREQQQRGQNQKKRWQRREEEDEEEAAAAAAWGESTSLAQQSGNRHRSRDPRGRGKRSGGGGKGGGSVAPVGDKGNDSAAGQRPRVPALLNLDGSQQQLPPLRPGRRAVARSHLVSQQSSQPGGAGSAGSVGAGAALVRPTPRALLPGGSSDMGELKAELAASEDSLGAMNQAIKEGVRFVMLNVPSENMTVRAKFFCTQWGAEKTGTLLSKGESNRQRAALRHWKSVGALSFNLQRLGLYLQFTAVRKVVLACTSCLHRCLRSNLRTWQRECRRQRREEADSAACECQRPARAFLAKRRVVEVRRVQALVMLQCGFRVVLAVVNAKAKMKRKRENGASRKLQRQWRRHVACGAAKELAELKRKGRRITLVQRKWRDYRAIKAAKLLVQGLREEAAGRTLQRVARGKRGRNAAGVKRVERQRLRASNAIQRGWRCKRARLEAGLRREKRVKVVTLQCWVRTTEAVKLVGLLRKWRAATRIATAQRCKVAKKELAARRAVKLAQDEAAAATILQATQRRRRANQLVQGKREGKRLEDARKEAAATRIQAAQRGKVGRENGNVEMQAALAARRAAEAKAKAEARAATAIQCSHRTKVAYQETSVLRAEKARLKALRDELERVASTTIQTKLARRLFALNSVARARAQRKLEDGEAGLLVGESATRIEAQWRACVCRAAYKVQLRALRDEAFAQELARQEALRVKAVADAKAAEEARLKREAEEAAAALKIQCVGRKKLARAKVQKRRLEAAEEVRVANLKARRLKEGKAATAIQRVGRGVLGRKHVAEHQAELDFVAATGVAPSFEVLALQEKLRQELFGGKGAGGKGGDGPGLVVLTGKAAVAACEARLAQVVLHLDAIGQLAAIKHRAKAAKSVHTLWSSTRQGNDARTAELEKGLKSQRSEFLQAQKADGTRGTEKGERDLSELESGFRRQRRTDQAKGMASAVETRSKASKVAAEGQSKAASAQKAALGGSDAAPVAAEKGVLLPALKKVGGGGGTNSKKKQKLVKSFTFAVDPARSELSQLVLAELLQAQSELQLKLLDAEMAERSQDGASPNAALIIQGVARMKQSRAKVKLRKEELAAEERERLESSKGGRGGWGQRRRGSDSSSTDEDEERYRRKAKKRKKRQKERDDKVKKKIEKDAMKRRAEGLESVSELQFGEIIAGQVPPEELPQFADSLGQEVWPGIGIDDNPSMYGTQEDQAQGSEVFSRMFRRIGQLPPPPPAKGAGGGRLGSPGSAGGGGGGGNFLSKLAAGKANNQTSFSAGGGGAAAAGSERAGGLPFTSTNKAGQSGGGLDDDESSDADADSSDEDNAFATRAFAAMGSTGKIVPLNRDMIRQEAEGAMSGKVESLLDKKLAAFEESKRELEALQLQLADKIAILENASFANSNAGGGGGRGSSRGSSRPGTGGGDMGAVPEGGLAEGWVEMFDEGANATYYFNELTSETSWTTPGGAQGASAYPESDDGYDTAGSKGTAVDYDTDAQWEDGQAGGGGAGGWGDDAAWGGDGTGGGGGALVPVSGGAGEWAEQWDDEVGATYWFNNRTLEASWTEPEGFNPSGQVAQTAAAVAPASGEWISYIDDETGAEYWYNEATQETTYEDPHWQPQEQEW